MAAKDVLYLVVDDSRPSAKIIIAHVGKNINEIQKRFNIQFVRVNAHNARQIRGLGVTQVPTLVRKKDLKRIEGTEKILKFLTPIPQRKMSFGLGYDNPEEAIHDFQLNMMGRPENDEPDEEEDRGEVLRKKMAEFQKKRPQMSDNVPSEARIQGGRPTITRQPPKNIDTDEGFLNASGRDNIRETPTDMGFGDADGSAILEDWYLDEANAFGKQTKKGSVVRGNAM